MQTVDRKPKPQHNSNNCQKTGPSQWQLRTLSSQSGLPKHFCCDRPLWQKKLSCPPVCRCRSPVPKPTLRGKGICRLVRTTQSLSYGSTWTMWKCLRPSWIQPETSLLIDQDWKRTPPRKRTCSPWGSAAPTPSKLYARGSGCARLPPRSCLWPEANQQAGMPQDCLLKHTFYNNTQCLMLNSWLLTKKDYYCPTVYSFANLETFV